MKIADLSYLQRKVLDIKNGAIPQGLKLDLPEIDEYLRLKRGNFNICVGQEYKPWDLFFGMQEIPSN